MGNELLIYFDCYCGIVETLRRDNKKRDRHRGVESVEGQEDMSLTAFMDLTDRENPNSMYLLLVVC